MWDVVVSNTSSRSLEMSMGDKKSSKNLISEIKHKINKRRSHTRSTTVERASEATLTGIRQELVSGRQP
jgi:hypothetical protein